MRLIALTQGQFALVDGEDFDWLNQWKWYARWEVSTQSFYAARAIKKIDGSWTSIAMHRQILGLQPGDKKQGDHVNHDTLDNRRAKLRIVTHQENQWNSRYTKGYTFHRKKHKFQAQIRVNNKKIYLGLYQAKEQARAAYLAAKDKYHVIS